MPSMQSWQPSSSAASEPPRRVMPSTPRIMLVTIAVYRLLLALCPKGFRQEYGTQMVQVLRQCCRDAYRAHGSWGIAQLWFPTLTDVLAGSAAEYVTMLVYSWKEIWLMNRIRASAIVVFCAYIGFVIAGIGFQKLSEYEDFTAAAQTHATIGASFAVIFWGSAVSLLAVLAGGLPLAFASLRYALADRRADIPLLFAVPVLAFAVLVGYIAIAVRADTSTINHPTTTGGILAGGLVAILVLGAIASAAAVSIAISRSKLASNLIAYTRIPATITAVVMVAMFLATLIWGLGLRAYVPQLFNSNEGFRASSTAGSWLNIVIIMGITSIVAIIGAARGLTAPRPPASV